MCKASVIGVKTRDAKKDDTTTVGPVGSHNVIGFQAGGPQGGEAVCIKPDTKCSVLLPTRVALKHNVRNPLEGHFWMDNSILQEPEHYASHEGFEFGSGLRLTLAELVGATVTVLALPGVKPKVGIALGVTN